MSGRHGTRNKTVVDIWRRELGDLSTPNFKNRRAASEDLVLRLDIDKRLDRDQGSVTTANFNAAGDILLSSSDDKKLVFWDWEAAQVKFSFDSGHQRCIRQAKIMPYTNDNSIITCDFDGEVRHAQISECGHIKTSLLGELQNQVRDIAVEPGNPYMFYSCCKNGGVLHFDVRTRAATTLLKCCPSDYRRSYMPFVPLIAITINPRNPNLLAVAGADEYTRLFDIRQHKWDGSSDFGQPAKYFCPAHLIGNDQVSITGLAFSDKGELLVSYRDEYIYLFTEDMELKYDPVVTSPACDATDDHSGKSTPTRDAPQVYKGALNYGAVRGAKFFGPNCEYIVSGSDCCRIYIWRKKGGELIRVMDADRHMINCIELHPHDPVLASSGIDTDIKIWSSKALERATLPAKLDPLLPPLLCHYSKVRILRYLLA